MHNDFKEPRSWMDQIQTRTEGAYCEEVAILSVEWGHDEGVGLIVDPPAILLSIWTIYNRSRIWIKGTYPDIENPLLNKGYRPRHDLATKR